MTIDDKIYILKEYKIKKLNLIGKGLGKSNIKYFNPAQWNYLSSIIKPFSNSTLEVIKNIDYNICLLKKEKRLEKIKLLKNDK